MGTDIAQRMASEASAIADPGGSPRRKLVPGVRQVTDPLRRIGDQDRSPDLGPFREKQMTGAGIEPPLVRPVMRIFSRAGKEANARTEQSKKDNASPGMKRACNHDHPARMATG